MATAVSFDEARRVADAVLFEGYLLYPYRASATKNQMRWQFGVVAPRDAGTGDSAIQQAELLIDAPTPAARLDVCVRFLHLETRHDVNPWDEGRVVERTSTHRLSDLAASGPVTREIHEPAGLSAVDGCSYTREAITAELEVAAEHLPGPYGAARVRVRVTNTGATGGSATTRDAAMRVSLIGTHLLLGVDSGRFVSAIAPAEWARPAVEECRHIGCFPVLLGDHDDAALCSPIILPDHPEIAPESVGPLFDATEIDEILVLRTLALGEDEKDEARRTDPRARELIDRVDDMAPEIFERLHGAIRSLRPVDERGEPTFEIDGTRAGPGSHVRMWPGPHADAQDLFWTGRSAIVTEVRHDVDGHTHVAVLADDDPGADVRAWQGRYLYFDPTELELIDGGGR